MNKLWKDFRTNLMYWRFRHITRNRLRLKSWWARRRQPGNRAKLYTADRTRGYAPYGYGSRERGTAAYVYGRSQRRSLIALAAMVILLTAASATAHRVYISPGIDYAINSLIIIGCIYYALKGV